MNEWERQYNTTTDNAKVSGITLNVKPKDVWKDITHQCTISQNETTIKVTPGVNGTVKVLYEDPQSTT